MLLGLLDQVLMVFWSDSPYLEGEKGFWQTQEMQDGSRAGWFGIMIRSGRKSLITKTVLVPIPPSMVGRMEGSQCLDC